MKSNEKYGTLLNRDKIIEKQKKRQTDDSYCVLMAACGATHSVAVDAAGRLWAWGDGRGGVLGCDVAQCLQPRVVRLFDKNEQKNESNCRNKVKTNCREGKKARNKERKVIMADAGHHISVAVCEEVFPYICTHKHTHTHTRTHTHTSPICCV